MLRTQYEEKSTHYMERYLNVVPSRGSKQKKQKEAVSERLYVDARPSSRHSLPNTSLHVTRHHDLNASTHRKSVPLNLHLQLMTVAPFATTTAFVPRARRYSIVTWGAPAVHSEGFANGGLYKLREELHRLEEQRLLQLQERKRCVEEIHAETTRIGALESSIQDTQYAISVLQASFDAIGRSIVPIDRDEQTGEASAERGIEQAESIQLKIRQKRSDVEHFKTRLRAAAKRRDLHRSELNRRVDMTDEYVLRHVEHTFDDDV